MESSTQAQPDHAPDPDDAIRTLVTRLARPHASGGTVIERATLLAEGADFAAILAWIAAHAGQPEAALSTPGGGLHGGRGRAEPTVGTPLRYVFPAGALTAPTASS